MNNKTITIGEVRLSYCNLFVPKPPFNNPAGEPKFSTTILVPKSNLQAKAAIDAAINAAIEEGVGKCWKGVRPPVPAICVHDGDGARPSDGSPFGEECKGCWVFTASCKSERVPFVVDGNVQPIIQQSEIYSGVYGNISVSFFAYENSGKKGIGCGLNGFQKTRDGEPLGNSISAAEAFGAVAPAAPTYPQQAAPAYSGYAPQTAPAAPAYPQQAAPVYPGYPPQTAAPGYPAPQQYPVDPITGQPMPTGMPVMGV